MSGIFSALAATATALDAQSVAIATTSKNISNVNNPNYSREYVVFGNQGSVQTSQGAEELGLEALSVQQYSDNLLNGQVIREIGLTSSGTTEQNWLQQAQAGLGQTITTGTDSTSSTSAGDSGLASALDTFASAYQALAAQPTDSGTREALISAAQSLADNFNLVDQNLAQVQADAATQVTNDVSTAGTLLSNIANLNTQIAAAEASSPGSAVDLRDSREADLEQLAAIIPVTVTPQNNGEDTVTTPAQGGGTVTLIQQGVVQGSLTATGNVITAGNPPAQLALGSGSIQGSISASTGPVQDLRTSLDTLASQIVSSVNAAYNPSGAAGGNFFSSSGTTAGSIALDPGLNSTTLVTGNGAAGDNSIALAVANLSTKTFSTASGDAIDGTFSTYYADTVGTLGQTLANTTTNLDDQTSIQTLVQNQRSALSGVNMDEEMSNLIQYQRAYQASSQVFNLLNQLMGTVITQLGQSS